eukprot:scaffold33958_cov136-Isochrysis_galbana.AAC.2
MSGLCSYFHWKIFAQKIYLPSTFPVGTYLHLASRDARASARAFAPQAYKRAQAQATSTQAHSTHRASTSAQARRCPTRKMLRHACMYN